MRWSKSAAMSDSRIDPKRARIAASASFSVDSSIVLTDCSTRQSGVRSATPIVNSVVVPAAS